MIITVTLNPAVDRYLFLDELSWDKTNVVRDKKVICGGKGINVSYYLSLLKQKNIASGFLFVDDEKIFKQQINNSYTEVDFLTVKGKTRENLKINSQNQLLEINDNNFVTNDDRLNFLCYYEKYCRKGNIIVLSGSLPDGCDRSDYTKLIKKAKENDCTVILDTSKNALLNSWQYADVIKPNKEEFFELTGIEWNKMSKEKMKNYFFDKYLTVVSLGEEGSLFIKGDTVYKVEPLPVQVCSPVSAGDSMVAAIAYGLHNKMSLQEMIKLAAALSSLVISKDYLIDFENKLVNLMKQVAVKEI
ncbi:MAG: 1-phosphofructokinase family hexose kinase [Erysipelotrichia bacterium]|nr:1-phosphofructokinase family hexose kinase [Erysipelotrichia bacterium]